jgi:hypothetical protein
MTNLEQNSESAADGFSGGILDAVIESEQAHAMADFNPDDLVSELLKKLKDRERQIVTLRYGLSDSPQSTLEAIGNRLNLTRERVRQVEKESLKQLKSEEALGPTNQNLLIVKKVIDDHGGIFAEHALVDHFLISNKTDRYVNALKFLLELSDHFNYLEETENFHPAWHVTDFEQGRLQEFHTHVTQILETHGQPLDLSALKARFQETPVFESGKDYYNDRVIENLLKVTKQVKANPFGEYGLQHWRVVQPKDVGDKAYLVLKHTGKPQHYTEITNMINQRHFDLRTAYKETVHNELIMDPRFVLVGRGIYALTDWGYKKGLVADIIKEILTGNTEPLPREKIIDEVLKQRIVRRNTILVGLANKKLFKKVGKNKYALAD